MSSHNYVHQRGGLTRAPKITFDPEHGWEWTATLAVSSTRYSRTARAEVIRMTYVALQAFGYTAERLRACTLVPGDVLDVEGELDQTTRTKADGTKEPKTRVTIVKFEQITRRGVAAEPPPFIEDEPRGA